jgi:hypothetical protein
MQVDGFCVAGLELRQHLDYRSMQVDAFSVAGLELRQHIPSVHLLAFRPLQESTIGELARISNSSPASCFRFADSRLAATAWTAVRLREKSCENFSRPDAVEPPRGWPAALQINSQAIIPMSLAFSPESNSPMRLQAWKRRLANSSIVSNLSNSSEFSAGGVVL